MMAMMVGNRRTSPTVGLTRTDDTTGTTILFEEHGGHSSRGSSAHKRQIVAVSVADDGVLRNDASDESACNKKRWWSPHAQCARSVCALRSRMRGCADAVAGRCLAKVLSSQKR